MDAIRFGLIGAGQIGRFHAVNLAQRIPGARLAAVCDLHAEAITEVRSQCHVEETYADYRRMLSNADIDAVAICTPGDTHGQMIEAAAAAGKHIFCEKPLDLDLVQADRALAAVKQAGVKLQIGFNRRFDAEFARVRQAIAPGAVGTPLTLHVISRDPVEAAGQNRADLFLDTTIHDLDMARFLIGSEVESVYATGSRSSPRAPDPDTAVMTLRFESGAVATIDNSRRSSRYDQRLELFGTQGEMTVANVTPGQIRAQPSPFFIERYAESYVDEIAAFVRCLIDDTPPPVSGDDGRAALVLALAAQRSYREGRVVAVGEVSGS